MVTTLEQAHELNLDVFMFPPTRRDLIESLLETYKLAGREVHEFNTEIAGFTLTVVAVKPRAGVVAPEMKKRKTVKQFIAEQ